MSCGLSVSTPAHSDNACVFLLPLLPPFMCSVFTFELSHRLPLHAHCPVVRPAWLRALRNELFCALRRLSKKISHFSQAFTLYPRRQHSLRFYREESWTGCILLSWSPVWELHVLSPVLCTVLFVFLASPRTWNSTTLWLLQASQFLTFTSLSVSSLFVSKYSRASSPVDSHTKSSHAWEICWSAVPDPALPADTIVGLGLDVYQCPQS